LGWRCRLDIRALFDDADELGSVVTAGKVSETLDDAIPGLAEAIVQFAGLMASRKVNYHNSSHSSAALLYCFMPSSSSPARKRAS